ncbi:MAG: hypothetical protein ACK5MJ_08070 [Alphaproteobacteria bacterium]
MERFFIDIWQNNLMPIWPWLILGYFVYIILPWIGWRPHMPRFSVMLSAIWRVCSGVFILMLIFIMMNAIQFVIITILVLNEDYISHINLALHMIKWLITIIFLYHVMVKYRPFVPSAILPFGLAYIILPCSLLISILVSHLISFIILTLDAQPLGLRVPDLPWFLGISPNWISFLQVAIVALGLELMYQLKRPILSLIFGFIYFYGIEYLVSMIGTVAWIYAYILPVLWVSYHLRSYKPIIKKKKS